MNILLIVGDNQKLTRITFKSIEPSDFWGWEPCLVCMDEYFFISICCAYRRERNFFIKRIFRYSYYHDVAQNR
jgi:hypothetical protein